MDPQLPNIRHLMAFIEVAAKRRIALAAEKVHLSRPAVTQAIAKLEDRFGARLFDRRPEGMFLTPAGELLVNRARRASDHLRVGAQRALRRGARQGGEKGRRGFDKLATPVQLQALVAVARAGSYSQAAREIGAKQPGVHRAVRDLQHLAGVALLEPVRSGVALTPAGEAFVHHARLAMAELRQGRFEVDALQGQDSTRIVVGALPNVRSAILPRAINAFLAASDSGVQVDCADAPFEALLRDLRQGKVDFLIGALRAPVPADDVVQEPLLKDRMVIATRAGHPLTRKADLTLADTLAYPWIAPPKATPPGSFLFDKLGIQDLPQTPVRIVTNSLVILRGLMMEGDYVTILSEAQFDLERAQGMLVTLPIDLEDRDLALGLTYRRDWQPTPTQQRFLEILRRNTRTFPVNSQHQGWR